MAATDILGKIGEKVGSQINTLSTDLSTNYATKVSLGNTNTNVSTNASDIASLDSTKADKVSLANYADGTSVFSLIKGTRAELGSLKVSGEMTVVNTQTVEVSDNFLELNKAEDGTETAQTSGININRGSSSDKASLTWDDAVSKFKLLLGTGDANLTAGTIEANLTGNVTGDLTGSVDATASGKTVKVSSGAGLLVNNVELGDYASFETEFLANL